MTHIRGLYGEVTWCGEALGTMYAYRTIEQVILNNRHGSRLNTCESCLLMVLAGLLTNGAADVIMREEVRHDNTITSTTASACGAT